MATGPQSTVAEGTSIRVGVALTGGLSRGHLSEFCESLAEATGLSVTGVGVWYYHRLLEAMATGHVDVAWLPPILAAQANDRGWASPIAIPLRGGVSYYSTALFSREGSRFRSLDELVGVRAAWVDRQSASGYLLIRAHLRALGVDLERAFAEDRFCGSHEQVAAAVTAGEADVGASFFHVSDPGDQGFSPEGGWSSRTTALPGWGHANVRVLGHTGPIPADVMAASLRLDPSRAEIVRRALIEGRRPRLREAAKALLGAEGFAPPRPGHLDAVTALLPQLEEHALPKSRPLPR